MALPRSAAGLTRNTRIARPLTRLCDQKDPNVVAATTHPRPPWNVLGLPRAATADQVQGWRYVVLEEIVDSVALLRCWTWPLADERGHLVWPHEEQQDSTVTPVTSLRDELYIPNGIQRQPRIGDTFAVIADAPAKPWPHRTRHIAPLLKGRVFDVSAEARLAARLAYQGSVAAISAPEVFFTDESDGPEPAPRRFAAPELTLAPRETPGGATL